MTQGQKTPNVGVYPNPNDVGYLIPRNLFSNRQLKISI